MDPKGSVAWTLLKVIRPLFVTQLSCAVCASVLGFSGPFFLYRIVGYIQSPEEGSGPFYGAILLFGMLSAAILKAVIDGRVSYDTCTHFASQNAHYEADVLPGSALWHSNPLHSYK